MPSARSQRPSPRQLCQCLCQTQRTQRRPRPFSTTSARPTKLRMDMFRWLNGPGAAFRQPLKGSTNYLNAYDRDGTLLRATRRAQNAAASADAELDEAEGESIAGTDEAGEGTGRNARAVTLRKRRGPNDLPPERPQDLQPFPLNPQFRSQAVLDEALREEIYARVQLQGKSVRTVSAELSVAMDRVAAVVRLKSVEKEWTKKVSLVRSCAPTT